MNTFTPSPFPLASNRRLIAPYWTDVDTRNGGAVWYRETTNATILQKASDDIHTVFPEQFNFQASWMFIATWSDVAFYGADSIGITKVTKRSTDSFMVLQQSKINYQSIVKTDDQTI